MAHAHVCRDATGTEGAARATALHDQEHLVSGVNPAARTAVAARRRSRTTTERVAAAVRAQVCRVHQPAPWVPRAPDVRAVPGLGRRRTARHVLDRHRPAAGRSSPTVTASSTALRAYRDGEIRIRQRFVT